MAKRVRSKKKKGEAPAPAPQPMTFEVPTEKKVQDLVRRCKSIKDKQIAPLVGSLRELIANGVEKDHFHKQALAGVRRIAENTPEQLAEYFFHRDHYETALGLRARAETAQRLDLGDTPPATAQEGEDEANNVTRATFGGRDATAIG